MSLIVPKVFLNIYMFDIKNKYQDKTNKNHLLFD